MAVTLKPAQTILGFVLIVQDGDGIEVLSGMERCMDGHPAKDGLLLILRGAAADIAVSVAAVPSLTNEPVRRTS